MKRIILILSVFALVSCNNDDDGNTNFQSTDITSVEIGKGSLQGNGSEEIPQSNLVITNTNNWQSLLNQMDSYNVATDEFSELNIDFSNHLVLAVFDDVRPHNNYSIEIENIVEEDSSVIVNYSQTSGDEGFTVVTQPFHIVRIPITNKEIIFE